MAKRTALSFNREQLTENLRASAGQGLGAFFSPPPGKPSESEKPSPSPAEEVDELPGKEGIKQSVKQGTDMESNMAILPLSQEEIEALREPAYKAQTFRLTHEEVEWIRDTAYRLSKEVRRGKVAQADIVRMGLKMIKKLLTTHKADLVAILEGIR